MKKVKLFFAAIFVFLIFTSCYEPIYYEIRKDVVPTTASLFGVIPTITRVTVGEGENATEFLALNANGEIKYKQKDKSGHGQWTTYDNLPFEKLKFDGVNSEFNGEQLLKVLSDKDTLFIVSATYSPDKNLGTTLADYITVYAKKITLNSDSKEWNTSGEWKPIIRDNGEERKYFDFYLQSDYQRNNFAFFQTNSPMAAHRKVFFRSGAKIYELSGLSEPKEVTSLKFGDDSAPGAIANSAVYFGDEILFFNSEAATTNETYGASATHFYFAKGSELWRGKKANNSEKIETKKALDAESKISCLATTADSILIGRGNFSDATAYDGGIARAILSNGEAGQKLEAFETNARSQLSQSYFINSIVNATPEKSELESSLYASNSFKGTGNSNNASFKNIGLWSYYPERGNWNRE